MREEKIKSEENNEKEVILQGRFSKEFLTTEIEGQFFECIYESRMKLTNYLMNKEDFWNMIKGNDFLKMKK